MGPDPPDREGPEQLPAHVCTTALREASDVEGGGGMVISPAGGRDGGSGIWGDWGLHHKEEEYGREIYCNATDS